jgi:uncharacterized membrane protein
MFDLTTIITIFAAVMSGTLAGIYFIFSNTIMKALAEMETSVGITVMQKINKIIINPGFMLLFMGAPALSIYLVFAGWFREVGDASLWLIVGGVLIIVGNFVLTAAGNVPLNNELEAVDPHSEDGKQVWKKYLNRWVLLNTIRSYATATAAAVLIVAVGLLM